ncbi:uncharacterized protein K452DRAFT_300191 [Aplosporella prunicola CBS 121167]|uniref:F-box domain-containing protein n=1 Tax=Aplosporella prunicola CBS 121167 TaxID=1176127 RepID=A0A6A6BAW3_9PEZI|nr:uncharacterized protein K452DRAFT_300191 [Aplosporella prunicola CBS 121167]KAF2139651.1 hypothetical protein K452DRAFT_300191 [Aplosporella prunicola CBS 121167]
MSSQHCTSLVHEVTTTYVAAKMPPNLVGLPPEMIENIVIFLDNEDLYTFRLTCKEINAKSLPFFGRTFFTARTICLGTNSIQTVSKISEHLELSRHMQKLVIGYAYLSQITVEDAFEEHEWTEDIAKLDPDDGANKAIKKFKDTFLICLEKQNSLRSGDLETARLTTAFNNFSRLDAIDLHMRRTETHTALYRSWNKLVSYEPFNRMVNWFVEPLIATKSLPLQPLQR